MPARASSMEKRQSPIKNEQEGSVFPALLFVPPMLHVGADPVPLTQNLEEKYA
jgi:hypothetical protein